MDDIKRIIEKHKNLFDSAEPSPEHFDKFRKLLQENDTVVFNDKKTQLNFTYILKVASVGILIILSGLYLSDKFFSKTKEFTAEKNTEFVETQQYYTKMVENKMIQIENLQTNMSEEQQKILLNEINEIDKLYKSLKKDYNAMPNDPRIIQALLQHYQIKTEVLNRIINDLKNANQINNTNHEKVKI